MAGLGTTSRGSQWGSATEVEAFRELQAALPRMYERVFPDPLAPRSVVVLPSLSLDREVLARITGVHHYEERMLSLLLLLRLPRTRVIFLSSTPIPEPIIDYYLHLLPGIPAQHARARLTLLACHDSAPASLTEKLLARPRLLAAIRSAISDASSAHMVCFTVGAGERSLALRLGVPIYGCDPELLHLGSKSGSRRIFREAGVSLPDGVEDLRDESDLVEALVRLRRRSPGLRRAVVKLDEGFSGEGNATLDLGGAPDDATLPAWVREQLPRLRFEARSMSWDLYRTKLAEMRGIVEAFVEGDDKRSPSVQFRVDPLGQLETVSTHDQILGGPGGQIFLGCRFPADGSYALTLQAEGTKAARLLRDRGVRGRFAIDFVSVREGGGWSHRAIEVNLRKGGTTHPFQMLQFLTDGRYEPGTGLFRTPGGGPRFYVATDNLESERYRGLTPDDLIDIAVMHGLHFHGATQEGVVFHMIGALSEFGKIGMVAVAASAARAMKLYEATVAVLDRESRHSA